MTLPKARKEDGLYPTSNEPLKRNSLAGQRVNSDGYKDAISIMKQKPLICTSIVRSDKEAILEDLKKASVAGSDFAELRLDFLSQKLESIIKLLISESPLPLIVTNRNRDDGGKFPSDDEDSRLATLNSCIDWKPAFIDIELHTDPTKRAKLIRNAHAHGVGIICSYHDFHATPKAKEIVGKHKEMVATGADVTKLVFTPNSKQDVLEIAKATKELSETSQAFTLFGMGKIGQSTRILCPVMGACLTYCAIEPDAKSNLAQISLEETRRFFSMIERTKGWKSVRESKGDVAMLSAVEFGTVTDSPFRSIQASLV
jgi:3-dehydroquinate dehydratase I